MVKSKLSLWNSSEPWGSCTPSIKRDHNFFSSFFKFPLCWNYNHTWSFFSLWNIIWFWKSKFDSGITNHELLIRTLYIPLFHLPCNIWWGPHFLFLGQIFFKDTGLYPSTFAGVCFWTEDWVFETKTHRPYGLGPTKVNKFHLWTQCLPLEAELF